jgi:hypothetical protein
MFSLSKEPTDADVASSERSLARIREDLAQRRIDMQKRENTQVGSTSLACTVYLLTRPT